MCRKCLLRIHYCVSFALSFVSFTDPKGAPMKPTSTRRRESRIVSDSDSMDAMRECEDDEDVIHEMRAVDRVVRSDRQFKWERMMEEE